MITKVVTIKSGKQVTLYFSEGLKKWVSDYSVYRKNLSSFEMFQLDRLEASPKMLSSIKEFYESTSDINQRKIEKMINESVDNINVIHDMILISKINRKRIK